MTKQLFSETNNLKSLFILDNECDPAQTLLHAIKSDVLVVHYSAAETTYKELIEMIMLAPYINSVETGKPAFFNNVAFANHGGDEDWVITIDRRIKLKGEDEQGTFSNDPQAVIGASQELWAALVCCLGPDAYDKTVKNRVDVLACELVNSSPDLITTLEQVFNVNFAASADKTGNIKSGADWVMETDGIDITDTYFDRTELKKYKATMWSIWDTLDCIPLVGTVARTGQAISCAV